MEVYCVICCKIELNPKSDIRKRELDGKPVFVIIHELFGLKIDAFDRCKKGLPHKICTACIRRLNVAYKLRCEVWKMQDWVEALEKAAGSDTVDFANNKSSPNSFNRSEREVPLVKPHIKETVEELEVIIKEEPMVSLSEEGNFDISENEVLLDKPHSTAAVDELEAIVIKQEPMELHSEQNNLVHSTVEETNDASTKTPCSNFDGEESFKKTTQPEETLLVEETMEEVSIMVNIKEEITIPSEDEAMDDSETVDVREEAIFKIFQAPDIDELETSLKLNKDAVGEFKSHIEVKEEAISEPYSEQNNLLHSATSCEEASNIPSSTFSFNDYFKQSIKSKFHIATKPVRVRTKRNENPDNKFPCEYCNQKFKNSNTLKRHIRFQSCGNPSDKVTFGCNICHSAFARADTAKRHLKEVHGKGTGYSCGICNKQLKYKSTLKEHILRVHPNHQLTYKSVKNDIHDKWLTVNMQEQAQQNQAQPNE